MTNKQVAVTKLGFLMESGQFSVFQAELADTLICAPSGTVTSFYLLITSLIKKKLQSFKNKPWGGGDGNEGEEGGEGKDRERYIHSGGSTQMAYSLYKWFLCTMVLLKGRGDECSHPGH